MKLKLQKKILAFSLIVCLGVTAVKWPLVTSANTETETETVNYTLSDDFSNSAHTQNMWKNDLTTHIDADKKNVQLTGATDTFLISDAMWDEGNKPTKLSFTAYTSNHTQDNDGLRVQLLHSENVKLTFRINTAQGQGFYGMESDDVEGLQSEKTLQWRFWKSGEGMVRNTTIPNTYTFTYDWSKWDTDNQVTIKVDAVSGMSGVLQTTQTNTFTYPGEAEAKPETFNVGFQNYKNSAVIDNVKLKYQSSNEKFKTALDGKYSAFLDAQNYATAKAYLKTYELLSDTKKPEVAESYAAVSKWLKGQSGAYTDDFSKADKTVTLWTNDFEEKITEGQVKLDTAADTFLISDAMWDEGNKPTKFSFTAHTSAQDYVSGDDGLRVQLLHSENVKLEFCINTKQSGGYHMYFATGLEADTNDLRLWQPSTYLGGDRNPPNTYTFTYDWSNWDEGRKVTVIVNAVNNGGEQVPEKKLTFTCTGEKPDTFKVGFQNQRNSSVIDDVSLSFQVGEATLKSQLAEIYETFAPNPTYQTAREYLKQYELLSATSKQDPKVAESYAAVCDWLKEQSDAYTDDFSIADKTAILWTNDLDSKIVEGDENVKLTDTTDTFLISADMWDEGNKPTKLSFTAYTSNHTQDNDGLRVQLLHSENVKLTFRINTAQGQGFYGMESDDVEGLQSEKTLQWRFWKSGEGMVRNTTIPNTYTFTYDWSKWDTDNQVTIKVDAVSGMSGVLQTTQTNTFTYPGEAEAKPETFNVGFQNYKNSAVIDNVKLKYQSSNEKFKTALDGKYSAFLDAQNYATAKAYLKTYELLSDTKKPEVAESYAAVSKWLKGQSGAYTDDFSKADKTVTLWTNDFEEKITEGQVKLDTAADTFLISDAMWDEGNKPTKFSFTAHTSAQDYVSGDDGLRVQLLHSENVKLEFCINTKQSGGYHMYFATGLEADTNDLRLWQPSTYLGGDRNPPNTYTFTYDWSNWDEGRKVTVIVNAVNNGGEQVPEKKLTFTCTGEKPDTFKVGFQNQRNSSVIDNVQICYENSTTEANALVAKGATISTSFKEGAIIRMGFDYSAMRQYMIGTGETLVNYGAVLKSSEVTATEIKKALENVHKNEKNEEKFTKTTYSADNKYMITVGNPNAPIVPNEYNVDIKGSDDIKKGRIDKKICAVGYVITQAADGKYHYYFTNTETNDPVIEEGLIQKSVMDLLYALNDKLLSDYKVLEENDTKRVAFENIVRGFKPSDSSGDTSAYTMDNYGKAVGKDPDLTLDKTVQKEWLKYVYIQANR